MIGTSTKLQYSFVTRYGFVLGFHMICLLMFSAKAQCNLAPKETRKWMPWLRSIFLFTLIPPCVTEYDRVMCNCQLLNKFHERNFNFFLLLLLQTVQSELKIKVQIFCIIFCCSKYSKCSARYNLQDCWNRKTVFSFLVSFICCFGTQAEKSMMCFIHPLLLDDWVRKTVRCTMGCTCTMV